jgi:hypothetical protein
MQFSEKTFFIQGTIVRVEEKEKLKLISTNGWQGQGVASP